MIDGLPNRIALDPDDNAARYVGHTADGRQFFLTTPFVPAQHGATGREFLALYVFDLSGRLVDAVIDDLGPRAVVDEGRARERIAELLASLGPVTRRRIVMTPYRVERFGVEFGLIPQPPDEPHAGWMVTVEPGNYMAFSPPWTSGEYDT